jgi:hypothetical protein
MTAAELERLTAQWIRYRASDDELVAGKVPGLAVEIAERTADLRRSTDDLQWSDDLAPVRADTEVPENLVAHEVPDALDRGLGGFMAAVGAKLLDAATAPEGAPQDLRSALARERERIRAVIFPKVYQRLPPARPMPHVATYRSEADPAAVIVYGPASAFRVKYDCTVTPNGPTMKVIVAATFTRAPGPRPCVARVPLP